MSEIVEDSNDTKDYAPHFRVFYIVLGLTSLLFFTRLWYLQIVQGEELRLFSERNSFKKNILPAPRGIVYDRSRQILIENLPGFEASLSPQYVENLEKTAQAVSQILNIPSPKIVSMVERGRKQNGPFRPVKIKENLTREEVFRLKRIRIDHPGLEVDQVIIRSYPLIDNGAHLLGYVGEISKNQLPRLNAKHKGSFEFEQGDTIGKSGLEEIFDLELRGQDGFSFLKVDARGRKAETDRERRIGKNKGRGQPEKIIGSLYAPRIPLPGHNMVITIDRDVQQAAYNAFKAHDRIGALVALRPNGEIVSWLSAPAYNPNQFSVGMSSDLWSTLLNDPLKPLVNKVIRDHKPPGSTFKPIVALAALQEKIITPTSKFYCPGFLRFGRRVYHCHLKHGHGEVNVFQAIERSCNVFFYRLGSLLGIDTIAKYARALGLGSKTGIELLGEVPGLIPDSEWKLATFGEPWQPGENLSNAVGQGFVLTNLLQLATAYSGIGSNGLIYKPHLVKEILDKDNRPFKRFHPQLVRDLSQNSGTHEVQISPATFRAVQEGLRLVGNGDRGTAKWWKIPGVEIAGKTGTAQLMSLSADELFDKCEQRPLKNRHHGWFVGYAPADKPVITVAVLAEHSCHGSTGAAPIVRDVIRAYLEKNHPELLKTNKAPLAIQEVAPPALSDGAD